MSIFTIPLISYMLGMFLLQTGKQSQFPFYTPFAQSIGLTGYEPATILMIMNILDIVFRPIGGYVSGTNFVRKHGQSLFLSFFIACIGMMNLLAYQLIYSYLSFAMWAAVFGILYALPVSTQFTAICEFADIRHMNTVLSINCLSLVFGSPLSPLINGALVDYTGSYWATYYLAGSLMTAGAVLICIAKMIQNSRDASG